jgi:hypothetical protein
MPLEVDWVERFKVRVEMIPWAVQLLGQLITRSKAVSNRSSLCPRVVG